MFRDSRGVVHTVCAADPLDDLPPGAADALAAALLGPVSNDLGGALERCDAVVELLETWQDAFFRSLPDEVDLAEEQAWAASAGMSLDDIEAQYADDDTVAADGDPDELEELAADEPALLALEGSVDPDDDPRQVLPEELVSVLERELLLLPVRTRLEALVAAADLVGGWSDLLGDEEKLLGHLILRHGVVPPAAQPPAREQPGDGHERLVDRHAGLHAEHGPGHAADVVRR